MNYQNYKKTYAHQLFYPAFAVILAIVLLAMSNFVVKSQRTADFNPSPFKFDRLPAPTKENLNNIPLPTTAGNLDPTFDFDGKLTRDFSISEVANSVAVQADGKIVAAGTVGNGTVAGGTGTGIAYDFAVFRYNADGSLDTSFDGDGKVTTDVGGDSDYAYAVAIQTDGKIVAAGTGANSYNYRSALVRYNVDGSLDTSFGTGGKVIELNNYSLIYEIAIQPDGKIVAAGYSYNSTTYDFTIARYNPNGSLDASFGAGGKVTTDFGSGDIAQSVAIQTDGKIVAVGASGFCDENWDCFYDFALARYNTDGSLDTSFDGDGKLTTNFGGNDNAYAVAIQTDGKIVAAGNGSSLTVYGFAFARYNTDGSLDTSFDGDGKVVIQVDSYSQATSVAVQSNGKIVAAGSSNIGSNSNFALARLNADGSLDTSFDADGKVTTDFGSNEAAADIAVQADGRIVAAGYTGVYQKYDFALSRYNADGSLDSAFDADGKVTTSLFIANSTANAVAIRADGRIVYAGSVTKGANSDFVVMPYGGSGSIVTTDFSEADFISIDKANAVDIREYGGDFSSIYVAGTSDGSTGDVHRFALASYFNGGLDPWFDGDGKVTTDLGGSFAQALDVVIQTDGKIIVVGSTQDPQSIGADFAVIRYNSNGSLDNSFGSGGIVRTDFGGLNDVASAVAIQFDGKIVAAGYTYNGSNISDFSIARYNTNGSLDTSFDGDGKVITDFGSLDRVNSIDLQPDDKIVAAGSSFSTQNSIFALARYNTDGSLDTSFDGDGKVTVLFGGNGGNGENDGAKSVAIQRNGKIVAAGNGLDETTNYNFALARFNPNGSLDDSFGIEGKVTTDFFGNSDLANAVAIQRDGKIVAAGSAGNGTRTDLAAARYIGDTGTVRTKFDYNGDGRADVSFFRPSNHTWYLNGSPVVFGLATDKITPADYDDDGKTDIAVYRPSEGIWYLRRSQTRDNITVRFGASGDIPAPADYDGDGKADIAVYRPSTGTWWILQSGDGSVLIQRFGLAEDKPVAADYDGDGKSDIAVYRPSEGIWYLLQSTAGFSAMRFGLAEDKPVVGDYDGDKRDDLAVFRPSTNVWWIRRSANGNFFSIQFGESGDIPAPADFDGDGKTDIAVFHPPNGMSNGYWGVLQSSYSNVIYYHGGLNGDLPTPSAFIQ